MAGFSTISLNCLVSLSFLGSMAESPPDDAEHPPSSTVSITVLSVKPVKFGKIFALASVEVEIDDVLLIIHGVRAIRVHLGGTQIDTAHVPRRKRRMAPSDIATRRDLRANWQSSARRARRTRLGRQRARLTATAPNPRETERRAFRRDNQRADCDK